MEEDGWNIKPLWAQTTDSDEGGSGLAVFLTDFLSGVHTTAPAPVPPPSPFPSPVVFQDCYTWRVECCGPKRP